MAKKKGGKNPLPDEELNTAPQASEEQPEKPAADTKIEFTETKEEDTESSKSSGRTGT